MAEISEAGQELNAALTSAPPVYSPLCSPSFISSLSLLLPLISPFCSLSPHSLNDMKCLWKKEQFLAFSTPVWSINKIPAERIRMWKKKPKHLPIHHVIITYHFDELFSIMLCYTVDNVINCGFFVTYCILYSSSFLICHKLHCFSLVM